MLQGPAPPLHRGTYRVPGWESMHQFQKAELQIGSMLGGVTACPLASLAALLHYGNWCGLGNTGRPPVDPVDACCQAHDNCYDAIDGGGACDGVHPALITYGFTEGGG